MANPVVETAAATTSAAGAPAAAKQFVIEVLYGEFANLFGDLQSVHYLEECIEGCRVVNTSLGETPLFAEGKADLVFMGSMTESQQELAIQGLLPHKAALEAQIEAGTPIMFVGNAMEVAEAYIENEDGSRIEALGIFPQIHARRQMMDRYNSLILAKYEDIQLVGHKAQFSHSYGDNSDCYFCEVVRGDGLCPGSTKEGLRKNNFICTSILGPLLVLNPLLTKKLLVTMGVPNPTLAFEKTAMAAYEMRLAEFVKPNLRYV